MPLKRKHFVVSLGKDDAGLERHLWGAYRKDRPPMPTKHQLLSLNGVSVSNKRIVLDWQKTTSAPLLSQLKAMSTLIVHPYSLARLNAERIAVIRQLHSLGYGVAVPRYPKLQSAALFSKVSGKARVFAARFPKADVTVLNGKEMKQVDPSVHWTRDLWTKVGGKRVKRFSLSEENRFGEGGKSIFLSDKVILANRSLLDAPAVKQLQSRGYKFYFVGSGEFYEPRLSKLLNWPVFEKHDHVDLFVGSVGNVLLVDPTFFSQKRSFLEKVAKETGKEIIVVPKTEELLYPANFLVLEPGKALVDRDAKRTISLLRERGIEVIPTAVSVKANRAWGGNVRCFINEL